MILKIMKYLTEMAESSDCGPLFNGNVENGIRSLNAVIDVTDQGKMTFNTMKDVLAKDAYGESVRLLKQAWAIRPTRMSLYKTRRTRNLRFLALLATRMSCVPTWRGSRAHTSRDFGH